MVPNADADMHTMLLGIARVMCLSDEVRLLQMAETVPAFVRRPIFDVSTSLPQPYIALYCLQLARQFETSTELIMPSIDLHTVHCKGELISVVVEITVAVLSQYTNDVDTETVHRVSCSQQSSDNWLWPRYFNRLYCNSTLHGIFINLTAFLFRRTTGSSLSG